MVPSDNGWTQILNIMIQVFHFYAGFYYCLYLHYQVAKAILILILKHTDETMHIVGWHCAFKMLTNVSQLILLLISMFLFVSLIHRHLLSLDCLLSFSLGKGEPYTGPRGHHTSCGKTLILLLWSLNWFELWFINRETRNIFWKSAIKSSASK